jgi:hypothetical protein
LTQKIEALVDVCDPGLLGRRPSSSGKRAAIASVWPRCVRSSMSSPPMRSTSARTPGCRIALPACHAASKSVAACV